MKTIALLLVCTALLGCAQRKPATHTEFTPTPAEVEEQARQMKATVAAFLGLHKEQRLPGDSAAMIENGFTVVYLNEGLRNAGWLEPFERDLRGTKHVCVVQASAGEDSPKYFFSTEGASATLLRACIQKNGQWQAIP